METKEKRLMIPLCSDDAAEDALLCDFFNSLPDPTKRVFLLSIMKDARVQQVARNYLRRKYQRHQHFKEMRQQAQEDVDETITHPTRPRKPKASKTTNQSRDSVTFTRGRG